MEDETNMPEGVTEEAVSVDDELGAIFDAANAEESQPRAPDGKFAGKEEQTEAPEAAASEEIEAVPGAEAEGEAETSLEPPASWTAAEKAHWPNLTRELQESFLRREGDWQKADSERANKLKGYEPIEAALAPVRQNLELNGVEPAQYVKQLVAADQYLRTNPNEALQWLANQYGIDLNQMNMADQYQDPSYAPLVNEINQLKAEQAQFQRQQQAMEMERLNGEIAAFAAEHPHFEEVRQDMGALIQAGRASDMKTAYDMAVWANPSTRAALQAEASAAAEEKRKQEAAEKSAKAQRFQSQNLSSRGAATGATPPHYNSRDEELADIYDQVTGAA